MATSSSRIPSAGRRSSPARRRASAPATARALGAAGPPGRARRPAAGPLRGDRGDDRDGRRRGGRARRSTSPTTTRSTRFADAAAPSARRRSRSLVVERRRRAARPAPRGRPRRLRRASSQVEPARAHRLVRRIRCRAMVERRRGDLVFVSSDVVARAPPVQGRLHRAQVGARGLGARPCRWSSRAPGVRASSIVRPGPTSTEHGHGLGPATVKRRLIDDWERWGLARHPALPARRATSRRAVARRRLRAARHPPRRRRGRARSAGRAGGTA